MTAQPKPALTEEEYLQREQNSPVKHEYYGGQVYAMAGASENHNLIAMNTAAILHGLVRGRSCRAYPSDMRIKVIATGLNTYPDFSIVCGQSQFANPEKRDTLTNPAVIIEILSSSTESYDRGEKFQHYRTIDSLQEYILIAQNKPRVERFMRHANEWVLSDSIGIDAVFHIGPLQADIALAAIYEQVAFAPSIAPLRALNLINPQDTSPSPAAGELDG
jgi:Uma2 family endonuclease